MTHVPAVSVLMTAYNRASYIAAAVESVLAQRFADLELIVVDDHSTDRTLEVARGYLFDPRVRIVANERNLGQFPNRNHAATFARGEFLKYHDSDDIMYPHCLEVMTAGLRAVPDAAFALSSSRGWPGGPCPMRLTPELCYAREFLGAGMFHGGPGCALFRTSAFRTLGGFPEEGVGSDYLFWLRACAKVNVALVSGDLFWYRIHPAQEMKAPRTALEYAVAYGEAWRALNSSACPLALVDLPRSRRNYAWVVARSAMGHALQRRITPAWQLIRHSGLGVVDWLRYFRPPRREAEAGTPYDAEGAHLVPRYGLPSPRPETEQPGTRPAAR